MSLQACDCHGKRHGVESLTPIVGIPDYVNGDPNQAQHGVTWFCAKGLREWERNRKTLEKARRAYGRRRATA